MLALTFVNYGESIGDGKEAVQSLMKRVVASSQEYLGPDRQWKPPESWRLEDQDILKTTKAMLTTATSEVGNGKHLQLLEVAMSTVCGLTLTTDGIAYYRRRLLAGLSSKHPFPLYVPIATENKRHKQLRYSHMLPAVARMVINEWDVLNGLLHAALAKVPAGTLQGGHGGGSPTKAQVKAERDAAEQRAASAEKRAASAEKRAASAEKETTKAKKAGIEAEGVCVGVTDFFATFYE